MNPVLIVALVTVNLALVSYTVSAWRLNYRPLSRRNLCMLSTGVAFDVIATACMIVSSPNSPFTVHGFMGYSALAAMMIDAALLWRRWLATPQAAVPKPLAVYSKLAYGWWVVVYITGAILFGLARSGGV